MEVGVLGPLRVAEGGRELAVGGARDRALLAALALTPGDTVSADQLVDALWGDRPPRSAAKQLQNHVLRVRKALGADAIRTTPTGYTLGAGIDVDAARFESSLREARAMARNGGAGESLPMFAGALACWRGRPFEDLGGWEQAAAEAARLEELRRNAQEEEIDARLACGTEPDCIADIESLVADEPLREHRWAQLMLALYRGGRQADALRAYQRARETLARELGIEPGPELQAMDRRVVAQDPELLHAVDRAPTGAPLPSGVVTFLLTDIEGSTRLWDDHPADMADALARHDETIAAQVAASGGSLLKAKGEGDSTLSVFARATDAAVAALGVRDRLEETDWPADVSLSVRCALHTGEAVERDGDYFGSTLNRAARIRALAVGGQILVSQATAELVRDHLPEGSDLVELGAIDLRDLERPERLFALVEPARRGRDVAAGICPYQGLVAYQRDDRERFFGRDELTATLLARLTDTHRVAVIGASGSGKSSLVRAGIAAALSPDDVVLMTPGPHPLDELAARLSALTDDRDVPAKRRELIADPRTALTRGRSSATAPLTIVVDQLEEAFTLCSDETERSAFLDVLVEAGSGPASDTAVVVALRGDFYGRCAEHPGFAAMISSANVLLGSMRPDELRATIEGPARRAGLRLEPGLADVVLEDVAREPGALPLVSHALLETWRRRDGNTLSIAGYRAAGGVRGAIARTADSIYASLLPDQQAVVRTILLRLTEPGDGTEDTRRRAPLAELVGDAGDPARREVLELLADARLVTISDDGVEVAHEALIREWPRLRAWVDEDRDELRLLRELGRAADEWVALDRDPGALYRGARLASVIEWARVGAPTDLTLPERQFLDASRAEHEAELAAAEVALREQTHANRRLRRLVAGIGVALVIALAAGVVALGQRNRADDEASRAEVATQRATVGRLLAESGVLRDRDRPLSALLAITASRLDESAATRSGLLQELTAEPRLRATLTVPSAPASVAAYTPDGARLVVRGSGAVDILDARRGRPVGRPVRLPGPPTGSGAAGLAISPDGSTFATVDGNGVAHVFDLPSHREIGAPVQPAAPVLSVAFSPDGATLATAAGTFGDPTPVPTERSVQLWDVRSHRLLPVSLSGHTASVNVAVFSPDGSLLATGGNDDLVVLHDARTGATVGTPAHVNGSVYSLAFSPNGAHLAVGAGAGAVVLDVGTQRELATLDSGSVSAVAFSPDGSRLATSNRFRNTTVWDAATFTPIGAPMVPGSSNVAFRPDGREIAIAAAATVTLWDPDAAPLVVQRIAGSGRWGSRYSPDGRVLAVPTTDAVTLYDPRTGQPVAPPLTVPGGPPLDIGLTPAAIAFSPDASRLAVSGLGATVELFDVASRRNVGPSIALGSPALSLAFSPDGKMLAVGGTQGDLYLVDLPSGRRRGPFPLSNVVFSEAFSPDGRRLVATSSGDAVVLDHLHRVEPHATPLRDGIGVTAAQFSPDGSVLAAGTIDGSLELRDGRTFRPLGPSVPLDQSVVAGITFSRDGGLLAISDVLGTVRLVEVGNRQRIGDAFIGAGLNVSFSPNGRVLAMSSDGGPALVTLDVAQWRSDACRLAGRNLTPAEQREYLGAAPPRVVACPGAPSPR